MGTQNGTFPTSSQCSTTLPIQAAAIRARTDTALASNPAILATDPPATGTASWSLTTQATVRRATPAARLMSCSKCGTEMSKISSSRTQVLRDSLLQLFLSRLIIPTISESTLNGIRPPRKDLAPTSEMETAGNHSNSPSAALLSSLLQQSKLISA